MVPTFTQIMTVGTDFELTFIEVQGCCSLDCKKTCVYHILFWLSQKKLPVNKELNWPWIKILGQISRLSWHMSDLIYKNIFVWILLYRPFTSKYCCNFMGLCNMLSKACSQGHCKKNSDEMRKFQECHRL